MRSNSVFNLSQLRFNTLYNLAFLDISGHDGVFHFGEVPLQVMRRSSSVGFLQNCAIDEIPREPMLGGMNQSRVEVL